MLIIIIIFRLLLDFILFVGFEQNDNNYEKMLEECREWRTGPSWLKSDPNL